jgi:ERCC4-type nuclease
VDLKLLDFYDSMLNDLELHIVNTAKEYNPNSFYLLRSIPGVGRILSLTLLFEIHEISRFSVPGIGQARELYTLF